MKPRAESERLDMVLQLSHQFARLPEREKKYVAASSSSPVYLSLEVHCQQLQSDGTKKLELVTPDCLPYELMLETAAHLLEPGKIVMFYDCT